MKRAILATLAAIALAVLGACAMLKEPQAEPMAAEPDSTTEPAADIEPTHSVDAQVLYSLLERAERALAADELTSLEGSGAVGLYTQVMQIDPGNEEATRGFERIVERYIALALNALERDQIETARFMLQRARSINADHPSIEPTAVQIRLIASSTRTTLTIDGDLHDTQQQRKLQEFADNPEGFSCRFVIWAKSDAQGRRIYQALRNEQSPSRLRAQILIRTPVGVEKQCFPT
jgi:hypothetical protein